MERQARIATIPFERRARWLVTQIRKELPTVGGLVYCNGKSWLVPVDYPKHREEDEKITYRDPRAEDDEPKTYLHYMSAALEFADDLNDEPDVSDRCLEHLRELNELTAYLEDSQMSTLEMLDFRT